MTGFFAATIGELITGKGALGQLALETNLPPGVVKAVVAGIVIFNAITALNPAGTTFSEENQADVRKRPKGKLLPRSSRCSCLGVFVHVKSRTRMSAPQVMLACRFGLHSKLLSSLSLNS